MTRQETKAPPLLELIAGHVASRGDHLALVSPTRSVTYAQLAERSNRVANALSSLGVGEHGRVAYLDLNNIEFFELLLGTSKVGAAIAPLNFRLTPGELAQICADAEASVLVVGAMFEPAVDALMQAAPSIKRVVRVGDDYEAWLAEASAADPGRASRSDDVVMQLYTSGTTGLPKGVMINNDNCSSLLNIADAWNVDGDTVSLVAMPLFHIGGSGWASIALAYGATNVVVPMPDPVGLLDTIEQQHITNAFLVPAVLQMMCAVPGAADRDFSSLRSIAYGASPITAQVLKDSLATYRCPLFQVYGLTETTGAITELSSADHDPGGAREHLMRSAGKAYPWVELKTVDPVTGQDAETGKVGEIWIRSVQNSPGYWGKPEETARAFDGDGWFHTGDAGHLDEDGYIFITDRIKDMIVTGAENVYPIEVETVLSEHPDVADVAVIGVPHQKWGEQVHAVVVRRDGATLTEDALIAWTKDRIAGFKRPKSVSFADELPRNPSGKLLKRVLRDAFWDDSGRSVN